MHHKDTKISVLGDGGWGTTLALLLASKGYSPKLWGAFPDYVQLVSQKRENEKFSYFHRILTGFPYFHRILTRYLLPSSAPHYLLPHRDTGFRTPRWAKEEKDLEPPRASKDSRGNPQTHPRNRSRPKSVRLEF